ncbi:carotenoid oxygenase (plasmid) [Calothrix sp. NIES-4071]|nr:carotenoid oxygenase [Calothrix sp. NIES-4071]BAZ65012.1 carotenoid oxygenase [Calothrix sp. NIES-4105]
MTTTEQLVKKSWAEAIKETAVEFGLTSLPIISGAIPSKLRGSFYCNGSARLERGGETVKHWFDGDGAVLRIHLNSAGATGIYRYVKTAEYLEEEQSGKLSFMGYGTMPSGSIWRRFFKPIKNVANTSVLALPDKLLALWEGGHPYALDLETLNTIGLDNLEWLTNNLSYSAHPKQDPLTKEIYNFGLSYGKKTFLNVYRCDFKGKIIAKTAIPLEGAPLVHDFVVAGQYLVFLIPPIRLQIFPLLMRLKSLSDNLSWQPKRGTQILVVDRENLNLLSRGVTEPWYQWHFGNGYVDLDGSVLFDFVQYSDFKINQYLKEAATGYTKTPAKGTLHQIRLNPKTSKVKEIACVFDRCCDFPSVNPNKIGQPWRHTYLSVLSKEEDIGQEIIGGTFACVDYKTNTYKLASLGEGNYGTGPIYAPDPNNADQGWILTVVYNSNSNQSEFWIFDAQDLSAGAICRLALPKVIPIAFHSTWNAA